MIKPNMNFTVGEKTFSLSTCIRTTVHIIVKSDFICGFLDRTLTDYI